MTLTEYLKEVRTLQRLTRKKGHQKESARLQLLFLLHDLKYKDVVWRKEYKTWEDLLRKETLCSVTIYRRFHQAIRLLGPQTVQELGATAASTLTATPVSHRRKLVKVVKERFEGTNPDHVDVARYVWEERKRLMPPDKKVTRTQLLAHINTLEAILQEHRIKFPEFPSQP